MTIVAGIKSLNNKIQKQMDKRLFLNSKESQENIKEKNAKKKERYISSSD